MDGGHLPFLWPRASLKGEWMMSMNATHSAKQITATSLAQEVVESYPQTIPVFCHHRMHCVGCYISAHHTIADCARENGVDIGALLNDLRQAISAAATRDARPVEKITG
jgi:hybrid cluster-associated redox disulfide protein